MLELFWIALSRCYFLLSYMSGRNAFPEKLTPERERALILRMRRGDEEARRLLIEHNLRLVAHISGKFRSSGLESDDLISIGTIGLIKAVQTFSPVPGAALATYAAKCIENAILSRMRLWFQTSIPRAEKNRDGVFWHRYPRICISFALLWTAA